MLPFSSTDCSGILKNTTGFGPAVVDKTLITALLSLYGSQIPEITKPSSISTSALTNQIAAANHKTA